MYRQNINFNQTSTAVALITVTLIAAGGRSANAQVTYVGTVTNPQSANANSAKAVFSISGNSLLIDLTNTGAATTNRVDLLSTVFFNFSSGVVAPADSTKKGTINPTTTLLGSSTLINSDGSTYTGTSTLNGSFVFNAQAGQPYAYGISSSGFSTTATTGPKYSFSGFQGGGDGGDDFGIAGFGAPSVNGNTVPIVDNGVHIVLSGFSGLTSTSQITSVGFGFASGAVGTTPGYVIAGGFQPTPSLPGSSSLLIGCMIGGVMLRKSRKK